MVERDCNWVSCLGCGEQKDIKGHTLKMADWNTYCSSWSRLEKGENTKRTE